MLLLVFFLFSFTDPTTSGIYTLSLHDALPIYSGVGLSLKMCSLSTIAGSAAAAKFAVSEARAIAAPRSLESCMTTPSAGRRSEEHTSELQSQSNLVCRLLLEKKNNN